MVATASTFIWGETAATTNATVTSSRTAGNSLGVAVGINDVTPGDDLLLYELSVPPADGYLRALRSPLRVHVTHGGGEYIVSSRNLPVFGHAPTLADALVDYGAAVLDLYEILDEDEHSGMLGRNTIPQLALLRSLLTTRPTVADARTGRW